MDRRGLLLLVSCLGTVCVAAGTLHEALCGTLGCRCPSQADPATGRTTIDCSGVQVDRFPCWNDTGTSGAGVALSLDRFSSFGTVPVLDGTELVEWLSMAHNVLLSISPYAFDGITNLRFLSLAHNQLERIGHRDFHSRVPGRSLALEVLDLSHNRIVHVDDDAFEGLRRLTQLDLSGNPIRRLDSSTVTALNSVYQLRVLRLSDARLEDLPDRSMHNPMRNLQELDLSHNLLRFVPQALEDAHNLVTLVLDGNLMEEFDAMSFVGLLSLQELRANNLTNLTVIFNGAFVPLTQLLDLGCSDNAALTGIETEAFVDHHGQGATRLRKVALSNNGLTSVNQETFVHMPNMTLSLLGNRWHCDCHLAWLQSTVSASDRLRCATPASVEGKLLAEVKLMEQPCDMPSHPFRGSDEEETLGAVLAVAVIALASFVVGVVIYVVVRRRQFQHGGTYHSWHYSRAKDTEACDMTTDN